MGVLLGDVLARRVPVSPFRRYRVSLQRKKCCQQIIGLDDKSVSIAVRIDELGAHFVKASSCLLFVTSCLARPGLLVRECVIPQRP